MSFLIPFLMNIHHWHIYLFPREVPDLYKGFKDLNGRILDFIDPGCFQIPQDYNQFWSFLYNQPFNQPLHVNILEIYWFASEGLNELSPVEKQQIWIPVLVFDNTKLKLSTIVDDDASITVQRVSWDILNRVG